MTVSFTINGKHHETSPKPGQTLLEYLRNHDTYSVKVGCDHGECGSCTVLVDGKTRNACLILIHTMAGKSIETVEGLNPDTTLLPVQQRFLDEGAVQCGYCTPGMILSLEALSRDNSNPGEGDIRDALAGNYCRCTGYVKPVKAGRP